MPGSGHDAAAGGAAAPAPAILVRAFPMSARQRFHTHRHPEHQLTWASSGILIAKVGEDMWVLPTSRALWIPATVRHSIQAYRPSTMDSLYFPPDRCPVTWPVPTVVAVPVLLRELIGYLGSLGDESHRRARAEAVVFDLLQPVETARISVSMPTEPRARQVAEAILGAPANDRTVDQWGRLVGASGRTLARTFTRETGMSFGRWRTEVRVWTAIPMLADGATVTSVARRVGYVNPAAFIA